MLGINITCKSIYNTFGFNDTLNINPGFTIYGHSRPDGFMVAILDGSDLPDFIPK